jgi:hypothetical protein
MLYTITSPTGVSVTKELTADEVERLQADKHYIVSKIDIDFEDRAYLKGSVVDPFSDKPLRVHRRDVPEECQSCSA